MFGVRSGKLDCLWVNPVERETLVGHAFILKFITIEGEKFYLVVVKVS